MFLEYWMLGVLAVLTGAWAEYRNLMGYRKGVHDGVKALIVVLQNNNVIDIDDAGTIKAKKQEIIDVR